MCVVVITGAIVVFTPVIGHSGGPAAIWVGEADSSSCGVLDFFLVMLAITGHL
jgi:hypothetical protein